MLQVLLLIVDELVVVPFLYAAAVRDRSVHFCLRVRPYTVAHTSIESRGLS